MTIDPNALVTDEDLGALIGVSARQIRHLAQQGTLERVERGRFELGASIKALIDNAAGDGSELNKQRVRKLRAEADRVELELAKARGEVALISEFERAQTAMNTLIRTNVMGVPRRAVLALLGEKSEVRWKQVLAEELRLALKAAAMTELDVKDETEIEGEDE
jgi:phage terminase Nu1 subunit (DNA packaging protein)